MSYIPDGVTEYDTQPDPLNKNRASRIRFAAACLPLWIGMSVLAKLLFWLHQSCAQGCNLSFGTRIGGAMGVFVLATFTLLRYQNIWLERRCNDAERGWQIAEWLFKLSIGLAFIGLLSSRAALLLIALGWVQFVYGLALPANPLPNIHGFPHPDTPIQQYSAWAATALAAVLPLIVFV